VKTFEKYTTESSKMSIDGLRRKWIKGQYEDDHLFKSQAFDKKQTKVLKDSMLNMGLKMMAFGRISSFITF